MGEARSAQRRIFGFFGLGIVCLGLPFAGCRMPEGRDPRASGCGEVAFGPISRWPRWSDAAGSQSRDDIFFGIDLWISIW